MPHPPPVTFTMTSPPYPLNLPPRFIQVLLLGCLHDGKVFWYVQLGAVAYAADLLQRAALRRRAVAATATLYPLSVADARAGAEGGGEQRLQQQQQQGGGGKAVGGGGRFVVLRIDAAAAAAGAGAGGKEVCYAGQHVWLMVSRWAGVWPAGWRRTARGLGCGN